MRRATLAVTLALAGATVAAQQRPPRDRPEVPVVGTAVISGTVATDEAGTQPLGQAKLLIIGTDTGYIKSTESDDQGRFALTDLPAGRYLLGASKATYVNAAYGAKRSGRPGTAISVADGQTLANLRLKLIAGGVVTGTVTDERGQPAPGASVRLQKVESGPATPTNLGVFAMLMQMEKAGGVTDDRGVYRLYGIEPGEYTVVVTRPDNGSANVRAVSAAEIQAGLQALRESARPDAGAGVAAAPATSAIPAPAPVPIGGAFPNSSSPSRADAELAANEPTVGYAPVYYPGTSDASAATAITIKAGEERTGVDIRAMLVPTARVECQVVAADGQPTTAANVQVSLRRTGGDAATSLSGWFGDRQFSARAGPGGRYTFSDIPPGTYTLMARSREASSDGRVDPGNADTSPPVPLWAMAEVSVNGQNVSGLVLTLQPGLSLAGRVVFNGEKPAQASGKDVQIHVGVRPLLSDSSQSFPETTAVKADGTFTIAGLIPQQYLLSGSVMPSGTASTSAMFLWSIQSVTVGGRDVLDLPIDIKAGESIGDTVITFSDRQQQVLGTLQDATGRPAPDYTVVLFAADRRHWFPNSPRVHTARPSTDGRFEFSGSFSMLGGGPSALAPGDYLLAAMTDLADGEQYDVKLLEELAKTSVKITVAPGQQARQDLRIAGLPPK
jgi:hypothetical protein